ncbi:MAG TPA: hypothetical protein VNX87_14215 [Candidatus Sulfotelmatobacter sp.]|jgi:hypothetical protein|nr:hypothetical protein [Candidatus Sulfotelmatobacter sp.]
MKLRIHNGSLRLRLNRSDINQLQETGICAESLQFGPGSQLTYTLESSSQFTVMEAQYRQDRISILLPLEMARKWTGSEQISLGLDSVVGGGPSLLIEKDFRCLHSEERKPSDDADSFPNPLEDDRGSVIFR